MLDVDQLTKFGAIQAHVPWEGKIDLFKTLRSHLRTIDSGLDQNNLRDLQSPELKWHVQLDLLSLPLVTPALQ